eukprot:4231922-Prymnesium_polylepis.2
MWARSAWILRGQHVEDSETYKRDDHSFGHTSYRVRVEQPLAPFVYGEYDTIVGAAYDTPDCTEKHDPQKLAAATEELERLIFQTEPNRKPQMQLPVGVLDEEVVCHGDAGGAYE